MYTISQVDVSRLLDKASTQAKSTEDIIRRFVFESCWATPFFKVHDIQPMLWEEDEELINRNELVVAVNNWFTHCEKCKDDSSDFPYPTKEGIWTLIREYYVSLLPYIS